MIAPTPPSRTRCTYAWALEACADEVSRWRGQVESVLVRLGAERHAVELARLGVSELLSNVCEHVPDPRCLLTVQRQGAGMRIRLFDRSPAAPVVRLPDWEAEHGRGLWMVRELADSFGYVRANGGKWVWFQCRSAFSDLTASSSFRMPPPEVEPPRLASSPHPSTATGRESGPTGCRPVKPPAVAAAAPEHGRSPQE